MAVQSRAGYLFIAGHKPPVVMEEHAPEIGHEELAPSLASA